MGLSHLNADHRTREGSGNEGSRVQKSTQRVQPRGGAGRGGGPFLAVGPTHAPPRPRHGLGSKGVRSGCTELLLVEVALWFRFVEKCSVQQTSDACGRPFLRGFLYEATTNFGHGLRRSNARAAAARSAVGKRGAWGAVCISGADGRGHPRAAGDGM